VFALLLLLKPNCITTRAKPILGATRRRKTFIFSTISVANYCCEVVDSPHLSESRRSPYANKTV